MEAGKGDGHGGIKVGDPYEETVPALFLIRLPLL